MWQGGRCKLRLCNIWTVSRKMKFLNLLHVTLMHWKVSYNGSWFTLPFQLKWQCSQRVLAHHFVVKIILIANSSLKTATKTVHMIWVQNWDIWFKKRFVKNLREAWHPCNCTRDCFSVLGLVKCLFLLADSSHISENHFPKNFDPYI